MANRVRAVATAMLLALAPAWLAGESLAQIRKDSARYLSQEEASRALVGVDMQGFTPTGKFEWRECIDLGGNTRYETPGGTQLGRLRIEPDGAACFAYDDTNFEQWSCFRVRQHGRGLMFDNDLGDVFVTVSIRTGVKRCEPADDLIG